MEVGSKPKGRRGPVPLTLMTRLVVSALLAPGACRPAQPGLPHPAPVRSFAVPWPDAFPSDAVVDSAGRLWFTDRLSHALGVFDPERQEFSRIATPTANSAPYGIVRAPDGTLWFGESNGGRLGRVDPATASILEIPVPELAAGPQLLAWAGGAVWFTSRRDNAYGRYDPLTREVRVLSGVIEQPYGIAAVGDAVFVASQRERRILRVAPDLEAHSFPVDRPARRLAAGPDGRLWFTRFNAGDLAALDPGTGTLTTVPSLPQPARPYGIAVDTAGRVWYAEGRNERVVVYDPGTGDRLSVPVPGLARTIRNIALDPERRRVWLPVSDQGVIALIEY